MQLVLLLALIFVLIGLIPRTFDGRQQAVVAGLAVMLAALQYSFSRFL
jgi:hypothetical protein